MGNGHGSDAVNIHTEDVTDIAGMSHSAQGVSDDLGGQDHDNRSGAPPLVTGVPDGDLA